MQQRKSETALRLQAVIATERDLPHEAILLQVLWSLRADGLGSNAHRLPADARSSVHRSLYDIRACTPY